MSMFGAPRAVGQRATERRECHVRAQVQFLSDQAPIDCTIINFSSTGVRVRFSEPTDLPSRFNLFIPSRPETKPVIVRWRNNLEYGLEYSTQRHREEQAIAEILERLENLEIRTQGAKGDENASDPPQEKSDAAIPLIASLEQRLSEMEIRLKSPGAHLSHMAQVGESDASELRSRIDAVEAIAAEATSALDIGLNTRLDDIEARLSNNIVNTGSALGAQVDALRVDFKNQISALRDSRNESGTKTSEDRQAFAASADSHHLTPEQLNQIESRLSRMEENLSQTEARAKKDMTATLDETHARLKVLEGKSDEFSIYLQTNQSHDGVARRLTLEMLEEKLKQAFHVKEEKDDVKTEALNARMAALENWTRENGSLLRANENAQSNIASWQSEAFAHTLKALEEKISASSRESAHVMEQLAAVERLAQSHAPEDYTALMERLSNLEVGMLDLRIKQPSAPVQIETFSVRLQKLEERNQSVMELLKHLLTHLESPKERSVS